VDDLSGRCRGMMAGESIDNLSTEPGNLSNNPRLTRSGAPAFSMPISIGRTNRDVIVKPRAIIVNRSGAWGEVVSRESGSGLGNRPIIDR